MHNLLIVESPAKAKTIAGYLSSHPNSWSVIATKGHLSDLPKRSLGVEHVDGRFVPTWVVPKASKEIIDKIREVAALSDRVYLASDPDREGEKISHDIARYAGLTDPIRISFNEITKTAVFDAIENGARPILNDRVSAMAARRIVDREVGYPLSSIIRWHFKEEGRGTTPHGVGRVISPALHLLYETEKAIERFVPEVFHTIYVDYVVGGQQFRVTDPIKYPVDQSEALEDALQYYRTNDHLVWDFSRKTTDVAPYPPLTTARLQRCAFYLFGFQPKQTMKVAQELFEGVSINGQMHGLISYPRTDSYQLPGETEMDIIAYLRNEYEPDYVLTTPREFPHREQAQEAHPALHPTHVKKSFAPEVIRDFLSTDQFKLYEMIWNRTLATQMANAVYDTSELVVDVSGNKLKARANYRLFDGWELLDGHRATMSESAEEEGYKKLEFMLPELEIAQHLRPMDVSSVERTTRAPKRFGVGRFITTLDKNGIARPSTIDTIVPGLERKSYISVRSGLIYVTAAGAEVDEWISEYAPWLNDLEEAKTFEEQLDRIETEGLDHQGFIATYVEKIDALKTRLGYKEPEERLPTEDQLQYARRLADTSGIKIPESALSSAVQMSEFISKHKPEQVYVGKCRACKKGRVLRYEKVYACNDKGCDFRISISRITGFIERFQLDAPDENVMMEELLRREKTLCSNLPSKSGKRFSAYIGLALDEKYGWGVSLKGFPKGSKGMPVFEGCDPESVGAVS